MCHAGQLRSPNGWHVWVAKEAGPIALRMRRGRLRTRSQFGKQSRPLCLEMLLLGGAQADGLNEPHLRPLRLKHARRPVHQRNQPIEKAFQQDELSGIANATENAHLVHEHAGTGDRIQDENHDVPALGKVAHDQLVGRCSVVLR
jgi:hypothetical protein